MQLNFKIKIGVEGSLISIEEPFGFDGVDITIEKDKENHGRNVSYGGESNEYTLNDNQHHNVFGLVLNEWFTNGINSFVEFHIMDATTNIYVSNIDFTTFKTDGLTYLNFGTVKKTKFMLLEKNKNINTDLNVYRNLFKQIYIPPVPVLSASSWITTEPFSYSTTLSSGQNRYFCCYNKVLKSDIANTLSFSKDNRIVNNGYKSKDNQRLIFATDNLENVVVKLKSNNSKITTSMTTSSGTYQVMIYAVVGSSTISESAWGALPRHYMYNQSQTESGTMTHNFGDYSVNVGHVNRGDSIWLVTHTITLGSTIFRYDFQDNGMQVDIEAERVSYGSVTEGIEFKDVFKQVAKDISGIQNVEFNTTNFVKDFVFNGTMLRLIDNKKANFNYNFVKKALAERCLGIDYFENTDSLVIKNFEEFFKEEKIAEFDNIANSNFEYSYNPDFVINEFNYKYKNFQAQKENSFIGNAGTVHGESQWHIDNQFVEGSYGVDLPMSRCTFLIEEQRAKALSMKENTSSSDDTNYFMIQSKDTPSRYLVVDLFTCQANFDDATNAQTLNNDGLISFLKAGITASINQINVDGYYYLVEDVTDTSLLLLPINHTHKINGVFLLRFEYTITTQFIAEVKQNLLNTNKSIRQNIYYHYLYLRVAGMYSKSDIVNTEYKENYNAVINNTKEDESIDIQQSLFSPFNVDCVVKGSVKDMVSIMNNRNGFIRVFNHKRERVDLFINRIDMSITNNCNEVTFSINGSEKLWGNLVITKDKINGIYEVGMYFEFDDGKELISIYNANGCLLFTKPYYEICTEQMCFLDYQNAKNYLLTLQ